ncbi:hypothetical protein [cf. Phormidesmis sp. LEGE 11477]|uniref:hypothetical protein n=1 Tax=cf. Phormidesmis sp. LEGE 11477 TaxID=1828680 RepID=UPI00187E5DF1|nr:hypothetical protein [cf. Phormidesmis sp. LEGE 11477]MBE9063457.1 hypothetical protein [cf. Phormidesmis sp. LEGE 11477]
MTEDLGHTDWEEVEPDYYIAADLVQQDENIVTFDILAEFDLQYARFKGDCDTMRVEQLRNGGFIGTTGSVVSFSDMSYLQSEPIYDASEGQPHHRYLEAACRKRDIQS